jgi:hypothetical protein
MFHTNLYVITYIHEKSRMLGLNGSLDISIEGKLHSFRSAAILLFYILQYYDLNKVAWSSKIYYYTKMSGPYITWRYCHSIIRSSHGRYVGVLVLGNSNFQTCKCT